MDCDQRSARLKYIQDISQKNLSEDNIEEIKEDYREALILIQRERSQSNEECDKLD